jgi:FkbM family methyltransferase
MRQFFGTGAYYGRSIIALTRFVRPWTLFPRLVLGCAGAGPYRIALPAFGVLFDVRTAMDIWSVKEAIIDRFYERHGFAVESGWTVVDIGAGIGEFTILAAQVPTTHVIALEPLPGSVDLLRRNIGLNGVMNVDVIANAVAGEAGSVSMDTSSDEPVMFRTQMAGAGTGTVTAMTLADVVATTPAGRIDLLKLDCEGAEYGILMQSSPQTLQLVDRIVMEYHNGINEFEADDLERFLTLAGYVVESARNVVHPDAIGYMRARRPVVTRFDSIA